MDDNKASAKTTILFSLSISTAIVKSMLRRGSQDESRRGAQDESIRNAEKKTIMLKACSVVAVVFSVVMSYNATFNYMQLYRNKWQFITLPTEALVSKADTSLQSVAVKSNQTAIAYVTAALNECKAI